MFRGGGVGSHQDRCVSGGRIMIVVFQGVAPGSLCFRGSHHDHCFSGGSIRIIVFQGVAPGSLWFRGSHHDRCCVYGGRIRIAFQEIPVFDVGRPSCHGSR